MDCKVYCPTPIEQEIEGIPDTGYAPYFFPSEGGRLSFFFTDETFTRVLSALINGAHITYGEGASQVIWDFLVNVEYPVSICDQIAECITESEAVRSALRDFVTSDDAVRNYIEGLSSELVEGKIVEGPCSNSIVAGKIVAIVERLNVINEDALEIVEVGTNDEEKMASFISGVPVLGLAPVDEALDFLQDFLEDFSENYSAAVTEEWKDEVENDLYCIAKGKPDCSLTYEDLFNYFANRTSSGLTIGSVLSDVLGFVISGDFATDDLVASGMYMVQLALMRVGKEFFGMTLPRIGAITRDALPSSKWEDWGDCVNIEGFIVYGDPETTSVSQSGDIYAIEGGVEGAGPAAYLYIGRSVDGSPLTNVTMEYSALAIVGATLGFDWGNSDGSYTSKPPVSAPPPDVTYAGGIAPLGEIGALSIIIETTMPFQGVVHL